MSQAAQSFFSDTVHDNLNVKVSEVYAELDFFMDLNTDVASQAQASDDEVPYSSAKCVFCMSPPHNCPH